MSFFRKTTRIGLLLASTASGYVHSSDQSLPMYPIQSCEDAKHGQLDIKTTSTADAHINAYLLSCAVSVVIAPESFQSGPHKGNKKLKENKVRIANHFLAQDLDLTYRNEDGDNVLMSIITSFLPEPWKEQAISSLLDNGIDLAEKNYHGNSAWDIAKLKGNERIVQLVAH